MRHASGWEATPTKMRRKALGNHLSIFQGHHATKLKWLVKLCFEKLTLKQITLKNSIWQLKPTAERWILQSRFFACPMLGNAAAVLRGWRINMQCNKHIYKTWKSEKQIMLITLVNKNLQPHKLKASLRQNGILKKGSRFVVYSPC